MEQNYDKKVFDWLSKEGYTLEMKVAKKFQERDFIVNSSVFYQNIDGTNSNEIDILTYKSIWYKEKSAFFTVIFLIECKYSKDKPWILFKSNNDYPSNSEIVFQNANDNGQIALLELANNEKIQKNFLFNLECPLYYGVTRAFENKNDLAYSAMMKICNAVDSKTYYMSEGRGAMSVDSIEIVFPIIVIDGSLYETYLDEDSELELNRIQFGKLIHYNPSLRNQKYFIDIVSFENIDNYIDKLSNAVSSFFEESKDKIDTAITVMTKKRNKNHT